MIIDQFEELFTTHPERYPERADFFRQLQECLLSYPQVSVLLSMREDYIAQLDYYAAQMPDRLRTRFRIEPLGAENALAAIREPARKAGIPFALGVAEALVDDLRRVQQTSMQGVEVGLSANAALSSTGGNGRGPRHTQSDFLEVGAYVEPVHLQIICRQLWERLPQGRTEILAEDVEQFGDVDEALTGFYERAVGRVVAGGQLGERTLRTWIDTHLITPAHTRGLVYRNEASGTTEGLPNAAATILNDAYIVRAEIRAGETWYELAHDRLIGPVLAANAAWMAAHPSPLARSCAAWIASGRDPARLLRGTALADAQAYDAANALDASKDERELLVLSANAERAERVGRRRRGLLAGVLAVLVAGLIGWGVYQLLEAQRQEQEAVAAQQLAQSNQLANTADSLRNVDPQAAILAALLAVRKDDTPLAQSSLAAATQASQLRAYLTGHRGGPQGGVQDAAYSADGTMLVSAGLDGTVRVWDTVRRQAEYTITNPGGISVLAVAVDRGGGRLAWGDNEGHLYLAGPGERTGHELRREGADGARDEWAPAHRRSIRDLAFSADGALLASAGEDARVQIWNTATGERIQTIGECAAPAAQASTAEAGAEPGVEAGCLAGTLFALAFSPDDALLAVGGQGPRVHMFDVAAGAPVGQLVGHLGDISGIAFSPDGRWIATAGSDNVAILWDAQSLRAVDRLVAHTNMVLGVAFSPDSRKLATGAWDGTARIWDVQSGRELLSLLGNGGVVRALAFNPAHGDEVATGSADGVVRLWDTAADPAQGVSEAHEGGVTGLAYAPDGKTLATVGNDGRLRVWELATGRRLWEAGNEGGVKLQGVAFSPDGKRVAVASDGYAAVIYAAATGQEQLALTEHRSAVYAVAFSPDGTQVATAGWEGLCRIFDPRSGALLATLQSTPLPLFDVAFSPDGRQVATAGGDGFVRVWDWEGEQLIHSLDGREGNPEEAGQALEQDLYAVAFSPDGKTVAAGGRARTILTWSTADGRLTGVQRDAHVDRVRDLAYSPDGQWLASASWDVTAKIWPAALGTVWRTLTGHTNRVTAVAFRPDGKQIATGGVDGNVLFTLLASDELTKLARSRLVRPLTVEECRQFAELDLCP